MGGGRAWNSGEGAVQPPQSDFIAVYRETLAPLYRFVARRAGGSRELAEDVTQEAYLRLCAGWRDGNRPLVPLAWLQTVARNLLLNHFRRNPPRASRAALDLLSDDERPQNSGSASLARGGDRHSAVADAALNGDSECAVAVVQSGLARLSRGAAQLIEAFHLDGKDVRTIAAESGLSVRAVEGRLRRARQALRREIQRRMVVQGERR